MKKILISVITIALITPQIVLAAWWNPFSWFKKDTTATVELSEGKNVDYQQAVAVTGTTAEIDILKKEIEDLKIKTSSTQVKVTPQATPSKKLANSQIISKIRPATVYIATADGSGSGMIFTTDGYILTNAHVVKGSNTTKVSLSTGDIIDGNVVGRDETIDLAVIKLNTEKQLPMVEFGDSDKTAQGDEVFTFGFPFGIEGDVSFKEGTISRRIDTYLETSAEIHPGNSGGPLVNRLGQVVGINTSIYGKSISGIQLGETIKLAIPINTAKSIIVDLKSGRNIVNDTSKKATASPKQSCDTVGNESFAFNVKYDAMLKSYIDITEILNGATYPTELTGIDAFKYWYRNWVTIHDQIKTKVSSLEAAAKKGSSVYSNINQDDLVKMNTAFLSAAVTVDSYYDIHLESLKFIQGSIYWDDYLVIKMKDMLSSDSEQRQKADDYYNIGISLYKNIQDSYSQLKTNNGCPSKITKTIKRSTLNAMSINSQLQCSKFGFTEEEVAACNSYRIYGAYYNWKITEDNK